MSQFEIKDSGERKEFSGGMVRDTSEGKVNFLSVRFGPMLARWAGHLTKGREKYPDPAPGVPNWTLAEGQEEYLRAKESAARHFEQWLDGSRDEDHASAVFFNINLAEYILDRERGLQPGLGATIPRRLKFNRDDLGNPDSARDDNRDELEDRYFDVADGAPDDRAWTLIDGHWYLR
jgi:hypothetical protein